MVKKRAASGGSTQYSKKVENNMSNHEWQLIDPEKPHWQIGTTKGLSSFLRAIPIIAPPSGVIYFESGSPDEEIEAFFRANSIDGDVIPMGSYDPTSF